MDEETKALIERLRAIDQSDDHDLYVNASILDEAADALQAQADRVKALEDENKALKLDVVAFAGPWAAKYAEEHGLPKGELHPVHYDILAKAGARMDDFARSLMGNTNG